MPLPGITRGAADKRYPQRSSLPANVKAFGAAGDGVADDTAAIDAAFVSTPSVFFPKGIYRYNGAGFGGDKACVIGESRTNTTIVLGAGLSLLTRSAGYTQLRVENIKFQGGFGAIRHTYEQANVQGQHIVHACDFTAHTGAAISTLSPDMPYWKITQCTFHGAGYETTMGVVLPGNSDLCEVSGNTFSLNRIGVKLVGGGNNSRIADNDFIRFNASGPAPRIDIWIAPKADAVNSGGGCIITRNKLGNEGLRSGDLRIVYADEDTASGADRATRFPDLTTASTGFIGGHTVSDNLLNSASGVPTPLVFSTTPNIIGSRYSTIANGADPSYLLQYLNPPAPDRGTNRNILGPVISPGGAGVDTPTLRVSNDPAAYVSDPTQILEHAGPLEYRGGGDRAGYQQLLPVAMSAFSLAATTTSPITDAIGGSEAYELTMGADAAFFATLSTPTVGVPMWVEVDVKQGITNPVSLLSVRLRGASLGAFHWRRVIRPSATWRRQRYLMVIRDATAPIQLQIGTHLTETGTVQVGRIRVYHAHEPQIDGMATIAQARALAAGMALALA